MRGNEPEFTLAQEHYVTLLAGRLIRECETREEFLKNPAAYVERWTGVKVPPDELEGIVEVVKEVGSIMDKSRAQNKVCTAWAKC